MVKSTSRNSIQVRRETSRCGSPPCCRILNVLTKLRMFGRPFSCFPNIATLFTRRMISVCHWHLLAAGNQSRDVSRVSVWFLPYSYVCSTPMASMMRSQTSTRKQGCIRTASREERSECAVLRVGFDRRGVIAVIWPSGKVGGICGSCGHQELLSMNPFSCD